MGREFELKFRADVAAISEIAEKYGSFTSISMETTYYDTADGQLSSRRCTLRRRMENGVSVCTFKCPHKDGGRGEWEIEAASIWEGIPKLCQAVADPQLLQIAAEDLVQVCGARFTRLAKTLAVPGGTLELALDRGVLLGGGQELAFAEVEVELKEGCDEAATAFAKQLAQTFRLVPEPKSKFARAMALAAEP